MPLTLDRVAKARCTRVPARCAIFALALAAAACGVRELPPPEVAKRLVVAVRPGPATWFPGSTGDAQGFDHDLVERYARERSLALETHLVHDAPSALARVADGAAHLAVGGLYRSASTGTPDGSLRWTAGVADVDPVVVCAREGFVPRGWSDLAGTRVAYDEASGIEEALAPVRASHPEVRWQPVERPSADALLALVDDGSVPCAVVASIDAALGRNTYLGIGTAFPVGPRRALAWAVGGRYAALAADLDDWIAKRRREGTLARFAERYFAAPGDVARLDAEAFQDRVRQDLPAWKPIFVAAHDQTGIDWRLLAAVAYQESRWDPAAISETGVRGFMQLTEETARHLGVQDRLDPRQNVIAAARYLADLKSRLPSRIAEPDRTWMGLAAFNIGPGHLEDARVLAQKDGLNPDAWRDVRRTLPLLALPEHYDRTRLGYARGGMPVAFVDRVRAYYDILLRTQEAHGPRLRVATPAAAR